MSQSIKDDYSIQVQSRSDLIDGFTKLSQQRVIDEGSKPYFLSFMFNQLRGNTRSILAQMQKGIYDVYRKLICHIVRRPASPLQTNSLPLLIACADLPVPKEKKKTLPDMTLNDGYHYHGSLLTPPTSRLKVDLQTHFTDHQDRYLSDTGLLNVYIESIQPTANDLASVIDYMMKSVKRGRVDYDDVLILPKSRTELPSS